MLQKFGTDLAETELPNDIQCTKDLLVAHTDKHTTLKVSPPVSLPSSKPAQKQRVEVPLPCEGGWSGITVRADSWVEASRGNWFVEPDSTRDFTRHKWHANKTAQAGIQIRCICPFPECSRLMKRGHAAICGSVRQARPSETNPIGSCLCVCAPGGAEARAETGHHSVELHQRANGQV